MKKVIVIPLAMVLVAAITSAYVWQTKYSDRARIERVIKSHLNDPDSAVFGDFRQSKKDPLAFCGTVNSRNRMGGMAGFTSVIVKLDDVRDKYGLPYIEDEHLVAEVTFNTPNTVDKFLAAANALCL